MKRIKFLVVVCVLFASTGAMAQDSTYISNEYTKAVATYQLAQKYNDQEATKQALLDLMVLNGRDTTVMRSLAEFYYNNRRYTSSALVALDYLEKFPGNMIATEIVALSYEQLRLYDKAIEFYQPMWLMTENINILYQIAYLQYSLKRYTESLNNLQIVDSKVKAEDKVQLNTSNGQVQEIPFKAAILNLRALIAIGEGKNEDAKALFNQALQLAPDFEAAKTGLEDLNKG
ncbi:MAG: tetratricopeptide repeat protein [Roseivirga sp.]|nr:tetratricopeptide repeat protein [Roseivirga sp.]